MDMDKTWAEIVRGIAQFFYRKQEFVLTGGTTAQARKPLVLDAAGHIDASMINDADVDHGGLGGLADDDHTQYALADGSRALTKLLLAAGANLTIASGVITVTNSVHLVDTEAAGATDDLDTINGGSEQQILILGPVSGARDVVVKSGTGNIGCAGGVDFTMNQLGDRWYGFYSSALSAWVEIARRSVT